jgi:hypothetical protein
MGDTIRVIIEVKETANELESIAWHVLCDQWDKKSKGLALSWHRLNWSWGIIGNLTQVNFDLCDLEW